MKKAGWQIAIRWVKAHAGTRGNEMADTLAKKATTNGTITECYTKFPKCCVKTTRKRKCEKVAVKLDTNN